MRSILFAAPLAAVCAFLTPDVAAAQDTSRLYAGVTGGSLGIGPELGFRLNETVGIRANATFLGFGKDFDSDDIDYDGRFTLRSAGAMIDVYPFGGGFRLSAGARVNGNKARGTGEPRASTYTIGGQTYSTTQIGTLRANAEVKDFAPAVTLGYGGGNRDGFVFGVEAGALFQGRVRIRPLSYTGPGTGNAMGDAMLADRLEAERRDVQDDIDDYKVYPILQLTLGYRF